MRAERQALLARLSAAEDRRPKKVKKPVKPLQHSAHVRAYNRAVNPRRGHKEKHPLYATWRGMIKRCTKPTEPSYQWYGARGISVCPEWLLDFWRFVEDMGEKPSPDHSIDRINVNGNYEKSNCRWATNLEQANNRQDTVYITMTLREWSEALDVPLSQVRAMYAQNKLREKGQ